MSDRPTPTEEQLAQVFRSLADGHASERARLSRERSWHRVQVKWQGRVRERNSGWLIRFNWQAQVGALAAACAIAALVIFWPDRAPLSYELTSTASVQHEADWVRTGHTPTTLAFSDGSSVELSEQTKVQMRVMGKHSAIARLEQGRLTARVHHADETDWSFVAGPFEVQVVGTAFDLGWKDEEFSLVMHEGKVRVSGPNNQHWVLAQGEELTVAAPEREAEPELAAAEPRQEHEEAEPAAVTPATPKAPAAAKPAAKARQSFNALLAKGRFAEIVNEAKGRGIQATLGAESASELAALAQAATYTGESALAERTWTQVRSRFPGSNTGQRAAFYLARLKEQQGSSSEAMRWLSTYLTESPGGVYSAEARGRQLVLARTRYGANSPKARSYARAYLKRYPEGAYTETARATLAHR